MRAVIIGNDGDRDDGFVGEHLAELGASLHHVFREDAANLADSGDRADLVVLLGSDWSVYDPAHRSSVAAESELVARARRSGVPVFAICYGAQLVAHSLGLRVRRSDRPEIGWVSIESTDDELCPVGPWFELHFDCWEPSPVIESLGQSAVSPQAFSIGRVLGVQFHPEVTPETAMQWLTALPSELALDLDELERQTKAYAASSRLASARLVDSFLNRAANDQLTKLTSNSAIS